MKPGLTTLISAVFLAWAPVVGPAQNPSYNPKTDPGDVTLPMPGDQKMVFRPVFLDVGDSHFGAQPCSASVSVSPSDFRVPRDPEADPEADSDGRGA